MSERGLAKQFLRFKSEGFCNTIASIHCNIVSVENRTIAVGACENVHLWNLRTGDKKGTIPGSEKPVSVIAIGKKSDLIAVGYSDGNISVWNQKEVLRDPEELPKLTLTGHKGPVSSLTFSEDDLLLASGGKDSTLVVWDIVAESGLCKLKGHKGSITRVRFARSSFIVSSSRDSFIKFWDLSTKHCFYTIPAHRTEVWDFMLLNSSSVMISGSSELELQVFKLHWKLEDPERMETDENSKKIKTEVETDDQGSNILCVTKAGNILRKVKGRVSQLVEADDESLFLCLGTSAFIDVFRIVSAEEKKIQLKKRLKKARKKGKSEAEMEELVFTKDESDFIHLGDIRCVSKPKSVAFLDRKGNSYVIVANLANNSVVELSVTVSKDLQSISVETLSHLIQPGHRADIRSLEFFSDSMSFGTASEDCVKIWNRGSLQPIRTFSCEQALSLQFAPGDRHCIVGTKDGKLQLFDIAAAELLSEVSAHDHLAVWSVVFADKQTFLSGGADKKIKFWTFCLAKDDLSKEKKSLMFRNTRTLELPDEVLCLAVSANQKFVAAGLLDNTARVYFLDTLKFFLSLYGHSLPVLCIDISSDSTLVITGAADRNVKIWGLDFGDCHRSLFAHDDSITAVKFVPDTHLFFSTGKDGKVKQWDADKFNRIQVLTPSASLETWALGVSPNGKYVAAASHDRSVRLWAESEEILILGEEEEVEREKEDEEALASQDDVIPGEVSSEVDLASRRTLGAVKGAENLIEAVEIRGAEIAEGRHSAENESHPMIRALQSTNVDYFILDMIRKIRPSDLEKALLLVPYGFALTILESLAQCIKAAYRSELACKVVLFISRIHHNQMLSSEKANSIIDNLRHLLPKQVEQMRDDVGFNHAALKMIQSKLEEEEKVRMFTDQTRELKSKKTKKKKKEAYLLQMN